MGNKPFDDVLDDVFGVPARPLPAPFEGLSLLEQSDFLASDLLGIELVLPTIHQLSIAIELVVVPDHNLSAPVHDLGDLLQLPVLLPAHHVPYLDALNVGIFPLLHHFSFVSVGALGTVVIEGLRAGIGVKGLLLLLAFKSRQHHLNANNNDLRASTAYVGFIIISMISPEQAFRRAIQQDSLRAKLMKYRHFLKINRKSALEVRDAMLKMALKDELIGEYEYIHQQTSSKPTDQQYLKTRQTMTSSTIKLINSSVNFEEKKEMDGLAAAYQSIADAYYRYGLYSEAHSYYRKLFRLSQDSIPHERYFTRMALSSYYMLDYGQLSMFLSVDAPLSAEHLDYLLLVELKTIEHSKATYPFSKIIELEISPQALLKNNVIAADDLGFLYSLVCLGHHQQYKSNIKWSSKLENLYLRHRYQSLLETVQEQRQQRQYHPLIHSTIDQCEENLRKKIVMEVAGAYDRCPCSLLLQKTGIKPEEVLRLMRKDPSLPLLHDKAYDSFIVNRNTSPLSTELLKLEKYLNSRYEEEVKRTLNINAEQQAELGSHKASRDKGLGFERRHLY